MNHLSITIFATHNEVMSLKDDVFSNEFETISCDESDISVSYLIYNTVSIQSVIDVVERFRERNIRVQVDVE